MNISEAAKEASYKIIRNHPVESALHEAILKLHIQSAIDAETAAKDAEIARLKAEVGANKHWRDTVDRVVGEYGELEAERAELVEALKKIAEAPARANLKDVDWYGIMRGMQLSAENALKKVGAE